MNIVEERMLEQLKAMRNGTETKQKKPKDPEKPLFEGDKVELTGDRMFSEIFGFLPEGYPDFGIKNKRVSSEVKTFVPPIKKFDNYCPQEEAIYKVVLGMEMGDNINIAGPTGSGKSSMVEYICAKLKRPFIRMNGRGDIETSSFLGQIVVKDGALVWKDGMFTVAVKHGAVFCSDEWTVNPPEINMAMQWVMEDGGKLLLSDCPEDEKLISPHKDFRLVCTDNTRGLGDDKGAFAAVNVQNTATLDRFGTVLYLDYLDKAHETGVIKAAYPNLTDALSSKMLQFAELIRRGYEEESLSLTMSPRTLLNWTKKSLFFNDAGKALHVCFYEKLPNDAERSHVKDLYRTVFNQEL
jgi:cobaltochelatase CobS